MINRFDHARPVSGAVFVITFLVWAWAPGIVLGQSGSGTVSGVVSDATTGNHLPGANVLILGTSRGAATDVDGEYAIPNVPAGSYRLRVSYIGYEPVTREITVDGDTGVDVALSVSQLRTEGVVVLGSRAQGQAKALSQQKNAANITNVVAADQIGQFPDATAPDALQRVPGIGVQRDQGEGRFIQIRGGAPQLTTVTFNGERIPSPEGDVRQIALDAVPTSILQSIEVSKAITPDMDADAIGGAVNLVTRRAPSTATFSVEAAGGFAPIREQGSGKG
ncbi:carboxypeptidase-like regulatory domain-containing protein, partial [Longibacter sp.]|uniref:carboxypeptidase-like regulatory domain-containing protein n=1 Tax=Longibacter sp. TaxID=2045415 RepID=UPI003EB76FA2